MPSRGYSAGRFAIEIDGAAVGFAASVEGGEAFAEAVSTTAASGVVEKQPGPVQYAPLVLEVDASLEAAFYDRVAGFLAGSQKPTSGVVRFLDYTMAEQSRLEWDDGLITEVAFPAADATSKDAARLRVTIQPERTRLVDGSGGAATVGTISGKHKTWLPSNFRFSIDGLENSTRKVSKVDSLVIRQPVTRGRNALVAGTLQVPDVVFTLVATEAKPFRDWFDDFVVKGNTAATGERTGSLVFLDPSLKDELIGVEMQNLGILRVSNERETQGSAAIARVRIELYCERMQLSPSPAQAVPPAGSAITTGPAPTGGAAPIDTGLPPSVAAALLRALRNAAEAADGGGAARTTPADVLRGEVVAERLLATAAPTIGGSPRTVPTDLRRERGRDIGTRWAATAATLDELAAISELDSADWTAVALPDGHSLIGFLVAEGELPAGATGPLDLARDDLIDGLVTGAADIEREAAPHLEGRIPPRTLPGIG